MDLKMINRAHGNYGFDVYEVVGIPDGTPLRTFIDEVDIYHGGNHDSCEIKLFDSKEEARKGWYGLLTIYIPAEEHTRIDGLDEELLDFPICCHRAIGDWGAYTYYVYPYGKHAKIPLKRGEESC